MRIVLRSMVILMVSVGTVSACSSASAGELDGRCFATIARTVRRDDVPGVAKDE